MPEKLTILLSEKPSPKAADKRLLETLVAKIAQRGAMQLIIVPSIYDLPADGLVAAKLAKSKGPLIVAGSLHPRALFWTLAAHGIAGQMEPQASTKKDAGGSTRRIWCIDLRSETSAALLDRIDAIALSLAPSSRTGKKKDAVRLEDSEGQGHRWYPVVDYDRCQNCLECLNFCLFGVYGLDENEKLFVEQPDACRDGCPACSRVCPAQAILFPMYADPAIAGAPDASASGSQLSAQAQAERDAAIAAQAKKKAARPASRQSKAALEKIKGLVDDFEELDL